MGQSSDTQGTCTTGSVGSWLCGSWAPFRVLGGVPGLCEGRRQAAICQRVYLLDEGVIVRKDESYPDSEFFKLKN